MTAPTSALLVALATASFAAHAQNSTEANYAQRVQDVTQGIPGVPLPNPLLPTKAVAIATVEPILFSIYGQDNITRQRPYEAHLRDGFWLINGTLPEGSLGGVFEIVIDANNCRVVRLTHGK